MRTTRHTPAWVAVLCATAILPSAVTAQGTRADYARAERFLGTNVTGLVLNETVSPSWIGTSGRFSYRRQLVEGKQFVTVDPSANTIGPAFDHDRLATSLGMALGTDVDPVDLPFDAVRWIAEGDSMTFDVRNARWQCSVATYECRNVGPAPGNRRFGGGGGGPPISPDGKWQPVVRDYNLYLRSIETGWEMQLTTDGERDYAYATRLPSPTLMVRQGTEEPEQSPTVFWSPDSKRLITYRIDARRAGRLSMVQHAPESQIRPLFYTYVYPLAQDSVLPTAEAMIFDVATGERTPVRMEPTGLQYYGGPGFNWKPDGKSATIVLSDRGYTWRELREIDGVSGAVHTVIREEGDPFFSRYTVMQPEFINDGAEVLWASERDGWMHLYLYDGKTGTLKNQITSGAWVVRGIRHVDEDNRVLYFTAAGREAGRDPYLEHLYRVNLDGGGLRLLTPEDANHSIAFSPDGQYFVDTYSRVDHAPISVLRRASDGRTVRDLEQTNIDRLLATGWKWPEPFAAKARDGATDIYGIIWRPSTFDPSMRYPVVEQIYTGPHGFFVPKTFSAYRNTAQSIAELGFVVIQVDGLGTARRSREFHLFSYRNLGDGGIPDHIAAMRQMAQQYPYMDLTRVGIYGHSAGGYDATRAILMHPDFYKVAVSSAGNHDHRLDKAVWNTQWMGLPIDKHYDEQSNVMQAHRLQGKLLLVHGDVDENVPVSATLRLVDALIKADKNFEMLIMPNQTHSLGRHPYFIRKRWNFFVEHLLDVKPPEDFRIGERVTTSEQN